MSLLRVLIPVLSMVALSSNCVFADSDVVAKVNGKPLTTFELNDEFQKILPMESSFHGGLSKEKMDEITGRAMNNLIEKELQYQYALDKGISVSSKELNNELSKIEENFGSSKKLKEALKQSGITKEELKASLNKKLLAAKAKEIEVTSKTTYKEGDVRAYYEKNKTSYKRPEEFKASHILIGLDPSASKDEREKSLKLAKELVSRIKKGESFEDLAAQYSTDKTSGSMGGNIGSFHRGMADEAFEKAVLDLKVGEISNVVETIYGYHIIKLTAKKPETQLTYDEVKADIKRKLEKKKEDELYKKWMDELKSKAKIEIIKK